MYSKQIPQKESIKKFLEAPPTFWLPNKILFIFDIYSKTYVFEGAKNEYECQNLISLIFAIILMKNREFLRYFVCNAKIIKIRHFSIADSDSATLIAYNNKVN
jgi:hypothetical protein